MVKSMDKRNKMNLKQKYIYYGVALMLVALICVIGMKGLQRSKTFYQTEYESVLPGKAMERASDKIRVLIKSNGFKQIVHNEVSLSAKEGLSVSMGEEKESLQTISIKPDDLRFKNGTIKIESTDPTQKITIKSLTRGYGAPSYRGTLELFQTAEGIVIINELKVEEYLYAVVPSEMPASYELEALKAQAVCARSYAHNQSRAYSYPEYHAHVDDSTSFQVYGNSKEQESTILAVDETYGEKIWYNDQVATAYYFSTSSGKTTSIEAWGNEINASNSYLRSKELCNENGEDYEKDLPWYRWTATISKDTLKNLVELNTGVEIGTLQDISITEHGAGGIVQSIKITGSANTVVVETENKIRSVLGGNGYQIEKQDGTVVESSKLLPSAFFEISKTGSDYIISGGGYGHGIGMSQNGANEMAKNGMNYEEILQAFYTGIRVE